MQKISSCGETEYHTGLRNLSSGFESSQDGHFSYLDGSKLQWIMIMWVNDTAPKNGMLSRRDDQMTWKNFFKLQKNRKLKELLKAVFWDDDIDSQIILSYDEYTKDFHKQFRKDFIRKGIELVIMIKRKPKLRCSREYELTRKGRKLLFRDNNIMQNLLDCHAVVA